jgi:hypothetical protein
MKVSVIFCGTTVIFGECYRANQRAHLDEGLARALIAAGTAYAADQAPPAARMVDSGRTVRAFGLGPRAVVDTGPSRR